MLPFDPNTQARYLLVGDPHVVPDEVEDARALMKFAMNVATEARCVGIVLMGDLHHTHAVVRLEVTTFWREIFEEGRERNISFVLMRGNHDGFVDPAAGYASALDAYNDFENVYVVWKSHVRDGVIFMSYCHTEEEFLEECRRLDFGPHKGAGTVLCHQTFDGSKYENGFPAPGGFDLSKVPQTNIISGHIHTPQRVGKCWYVGAPRWRSVSDANVDRAIWMVAFDMKTGVPVSWVPHDTGSVCSRIIHLVDSPAAPAPTEMDPRHRYHVDVVGPREWVDARKSAFPGARIRTSVTGAAPPRVRESGNLEESFLRFAGDFRARNGVPGEVLARMARERMGLSP